MPIYILGESPNFPDPKNAHHSGLLGVGGNLKPKRLIQAYRSGIFPWFNEGDIPHWWSPDPRFVMIPSQFKMRRTLRKTIRKGRYQIRFDTAFKQVITQCSMRPRPNQNGTWITRTMKKSYIRLHQMGFAHSVEAYHEDRLVGGLYGIGMGPFFFGESMFYLEPEASKVALAALVERYRDAPFIDCQMHNPFFEFMGAVHIPRSVFLKILRERIDESDNWKETAKDHESQSSHSGQ